MAIRTPTPVERHQERRPAVGDERQGDALRGQRADGDADVDERLEPDPRRDPERHQATEDIGSPHRDRAAGDGEHQEQRDHEHGADEAELLADHGQDEIGVGLGEEAPLRAGVARGPIRRTPRTRGRSGTGGPGSRRSVFLSGSRKAINRSTRNCSRNSSAPTDDHPEHPGQRRDGPQRGAGQEEHHQDDETQQHGGAEVVAGQHERTHQAHDHDRSA